VNTCPYWHDHPEGDPSFDDCMAAAAAARRALPNCLVCRQPVSAADESVRTPTWVAHRECLYRRDRRRQRRQATT